MKFYYLSTNNSYPQNRHLIDGLIENGHKVFEVEEKSQGIGKYIKIIKDFWPQRHSYDAVIIGLTSPHFVPIIRLIFFKKIIYNGGFSQYEANIISRATNKKMSLGALKWWIKDFISFLLSSKILLESNAQIDYIHKLFFVPRKKLIRAWAGVDEKEFFFDKNIEKNKKFTVLFRGRFLPESGIDTVIKTAKLLEKEDVYFLIIGHGFLYKIVNPLMEKLHPKNINMIEKTLSFNDLREKMLSCHISLGQLANNKRLSRTLPCKLFESLALKLPYLTGKNTATLELLKENQTCLVVEPANPKKLAEKILYLKNNPEILENIAEQGYKLYKEKLTSKQLAKEFVRSCF
ncbi:MAG: glycosyltransferase family 4 protein [Candidatus Pacebacteria bacterium]|nr:glycosyltransferase family 4 protein [Candidatus Paceibacterota bacterium]